VQIPEYLDRSSIVVPTGSAGLSPLAGHRWAEPLKDAIPRILRQDLSALLGAQHVWAAPVPPGVVITRQLRLELLRFEASADRRQVRLQARWSLADPAGKSPPAAGQATQPRSMPWWPPTGRRCCCWPGRSSAAPASQRPALRRPAGPWSR